MRPIKISLIHGAFLQGLKEIEDRFVAVSAALAADRARQAWVAEMSLVSGVTLWEGYLTELLIAHICHDPSVFIAEFGLPPKSTIVTRPLVEAVFAGLRYLEIRGYQDIQKFGNTYVEAKRNPFGKVGDALAKSLDDSLKIRNHIVHDSRQSKAAYQRVLHRQGLAGKVPKPGFFLIAQHAGKTRLATQIENMRKAVAALR